MTKLLAIACAATVILSMTVVPAAQTDRQSVERIRSALQRSPAVLISSAAPPLTGSSKPLWGGLTLVQPDATKGEIVALRIPVGALAMRAVHAAATAHHRREERKAHEAVGQALADFAVKPQQ